MSTIVLIMENIQIISIFGKSKLRRDLLALFFTNPEAKYYARQLEGMLKVSIGSLHRELRSLENQDILNSEIFGNLKLYSVNDKHVLYKEMKAIIAKTFGIEGSLRELLKSIAKIELAFVYGSFAAGTEKAGSDIDLFLVGDFDIGLLNKKLRDLEQILLREVNYTHMSGKEFAAAKNIGDAFVKKILEEPKLWLIGDLGGF